MAKDNTKNLTEGKPLKLIFQFAIPLWFGYLFQQVYGMVDTMIVGKAIDVKALAAVGATGCICFLIIGFCCGVCDGFALPVAQRFGANDYQGLKKMVGNAIVMALALCVVLTTVTIILCGNIIDWMRTPKDIKDMAYNYLLIIFIGIPGSMLYNFSAGLLRAVGNSKVPLYILAISSALNIGLDLLFILVFHWGVAGAAWATIISQMISGVLAVAYIYWRMPVLHLEREHLRLEGGTCKILLGMGLPMGFQYSITAIGTVAVQTSVNGLGSEYVAGMTAASKIDMLTETVFSSFGATMATFSGQNVGAGKYERVKKGLLDTTLVIGIYSIIVGLVFGFLGKPLLMLYVKSSEVEVLKHGYTCLLWLGVFYIPLAVLNLFRFTIQGMGFSAFSLFAGIAELVGRSAVALLLVPVFGYIAACFASPAAWILACVFLVPAFFWCLNKLRKSQ